MTVSRVKRILVLADAQDSMQCVLMHEQRSNPPVAEISIDGTRHSGFSWTVAIAGRTITYDGQPVRTPTEAVWLAVDAIRDDGDHRGVVTIYDADHRRVARSPLWAVPQYDIAIPSAG
jgi:hypothetical protein